MEIMIYRQDDQITGKLSHNIVESLPISILDCLTVKIARHFSFLKFCDWPAHRALTMKVTSINVFSFFLKQIPRHPGIS